MLKDLVLKNRSYRRFYQEVKIDINDLKDLVDLARTTPSTVNSQALKFLIVNNETDNEKVFRTLSWAGLLKDWSGPEDGEKPSAYIIILCDFEFGKNKSIDDGIASQTIMLGAVEKGLGGCMFGSINRKQLAEEFSIDLEKYSIDLVLAIGKPKETVKIVDLPKNKSTAYYRDEQGVHYVPKRALEDIIL